ncbi:hypothetical protein SEA_YEET_59 [Mycobacterium phage Yeet]|nr:hypothetical protein SEA_YEET_59 [Mycobacterium phage Yeet]
MALSEEYISSSLRELTKALRSLTGEGPLGVLGGDNGYGCDYENDVFMMHPFCWCERMDCPWCLDCECPDGVYQYFVDGQAVNSETYYEANPRARSYRIVEELQCDGCVKRRTTGFAPNFLYKPTGGEVHWYKYIGRGMEIKGDLPVDFLVKCLESLR